MLLVLAPDLLDLASNVRVSQRRDGGIQHCEVLLLGGDARLGGRMQVAVAQ